MRNRITTKWGTGKDSWWGERLSGHSHAKADPREPLRPFLSPVGQVSDLPVAACSAGQFPLSPVPTFSIQHSAFSLCHAPVWLTPPPAEIAQPSQTQSNPVKPNFFPKAHETTPFILRPSRDGALRRPYSAVFCLSLA